ncbi:MAG: methionine adenosyltransferase [Armatimonadetes bacterium]|nr:methionine adenosyltransferase [Armatimonadota bacterium]
MSYKPFTSESVTEGHPDKLADQISDAILDEMIAKDRNSRVAVETFLTRGLAAVGGEVTTESYVEIPDVVRRTINEVGYTQVQYGFDGDTCGVMVAIQKQSPDIAVGVDAGGAGDQGMMFGYACTETSELMPLPIMMAHKFTRRMAQVRRSHPDIGIRPDGKSQITIIYEDGKPHHIDTIVLAIQHEPTLKRADLEAIAHEYLVEPVLKEYAAFRKGDIKYHINPTGVFEIGGPQADTGLTGRKIIVDTYGGMARHGGGCFSGKDPTKVDRSATYMARHIAKNVVAAGLAERCEIQLAYAIGYKDPVSVLVETFGTGKIADEEISKRVTSLFDLTPRGIIEHLDLLKPVYRESARNGHFGREEFSWEQAHHAERLK